MHHRPGLHRPATRPGLGLLWLLGRRQLHTGITAASGTSKPARRRCEINLKRVQLRRQGVDLRPPRPIFLMAMMMSTLKLRLQPTRRPTISPQMFWIIGAVSCQAAEVKKLDPLRLLFPRLPQLASEGSIHAHLIHDLRLQYGNLRRQFRVIPPIIMTHAHTQINQVRMKGTCTRCPLSTLTCEHVCLTILTYEEGSTHYLPLYYEPKLLHQSTVLCQLFVLPTITGYAISRRWIFDAKAFDALKNSVKQRAVGVDQQTMFLQRVSMMMKKTMMMMKVEIMHQF
jgi:hypothetical protein